MDKSSTSVETAAATPYVVVARRYRPQSFTELIGQEHVAQALSNAISTSRVGHAYLFTGARGVGKTSSARILAKALNCVDGPTPTPCNECDICRSIGSGDDVDVLEIDGASNRGIDEIRQLRQNVNVRPSRARFKIYIIDEVHMLTREAFNALLKTLEEPPEHVKFIFCTTEPTKIPITILSRCQRFDFAGISTRSILERLKQITAAEGVEAESDALEVIARRAAGSMRDSQSLLEQLLAFAPGRITVQDVHGMLGTAGDQRLAALVHHLVGRNAAAALAELDGAAHEGVDVALLIEQLFGYFRDCMAAAVGCPAETFLYAPPGSNADVVEAGRQLGLQTILAAMQILDQSLSRLRVSTQSRIIAELALVRICHLEELDELAAWIAQLQSGLPAPSLSASPRLTAGTPATARPLAMSLAEKKNAELADREPIAKPSARGELAPSLATPAAVTETPAEPAGPTVALTEQSAAQVWDLALQKIPAGLIVENARQCYRVSVAGPNRLVVSFPTTTGGFAKALCQKVEHQSRFERALAEVTGQNVRVEFTLVDAGAQPGNVAAPARPAISSQQRIQEAAKHPMIQRAVELFGAQAIGVEEG